MNNPFFSIVLAVYNGEDYIEESIKSVLNQTYKNFELIIVDDCSTDKTAHILKKYENIENVRIFRNKLNRERSFSRNYAIKIALGNWITLLDHDDLFTQNRLEVLKNFINKNKNSYFIVNEAYLIDKNSKIFSTLSIRKKIDFKKSMLKKNLISLQSVCIKKELFNEFAFDESINSSEDYKLWLEILHKYKVSLIHEPLTLIRKEFHHEIDTYKSRIKSHINVRKNHLKDIGDKNYKKIYISEIFRLMMPNILLQIIRIIRAKIK